MMGATGTIGRATTAALLRRGHEVVCLIRRQPDGRPALPAGALLRYGEVTDPVSLVRDGIAGEKFDAIVSCLGHLHEV
jgi:divinyl chlorophyllide a 8-vinyl-reductase